MDNNPVRIKLLLALPDFTLSFYLLIIPIYVILFNWYCLNDPILEDSLHCLQHTLLLDEVEILLNQLSQARNSLVQVLMPDVVEAEYALSYLLSIASSPKLCQLVDDLLVILWLDRSTVLTNTTKYTLTPGRSRVSYLGNELSMMLVTWWSTNGFSKRSNTSEANFCNSSIGKLRVCINSSNCTLWMYLPRTGCSQASRTMLTPLK